MAPRLSSDTQRRLDLLFKPRDRAEAARLLVEECGNNLPFLGNADEYQLERIRFAVLRVSLGELPRLRTAVETAKLDWRDVLLYAGFADDVHAHKHWLPGTPEGERRVMDQVMADWNARLAALRPEWGRRMLDLLIKILVVGGIVALAILAA